MIAYTSFNKLKMKKSYPVGSNGLFNSKTIFGEDFTVNSWYGNILFDCNIIRLDPIFGRVQSTNENIITDCVFGRKMESLVID